MSNDKVQLVSPLFLRYQADFEKNPRSRVFAPLAEMYRKMGMTDKAMEILAHGIKYHQDYLMGHLGLAFCYYDIKQYRLAYNTIKPLVDDNRDNIRLQKLFIDTCLALDLSKEALDTCKYILFLNPKDTEAAEIVTRLERELERSHRHEHKPIFIPTEEFQKSDLKNIETSNEDLFDFDNWKPVNLVADSHALQEESDAFDQWNVQKLEEVDNKIEVKVADLVETSFDEENIEDVEIQHPEEELSFAINYEVEKVETPLSVSMDNHRDEVSAPSSLEKKMAQELPMITHTLVDLYCGQGHFEKAIEVLDKILELNPNEERTIKKKNEILSMLSGSAPTVQIQSTKKQSKQLKVETEEDGRKSLMDIFDQSIGSFNLGEIEIDEDEDKEELPLKESASASNNLAKSLKENLLILKEHSEIKSKSVQSNDAKMIDQRRNQAIETKLNKFLANIRKRAIDYQGTF